MYANTQIEEETSTKKVETPIKRGLRKKVKLFQEKVRRQNQKNNQDWGLFKIYLIIKLLHNSCLLHNKD